MQNLKLLKLCVKKNPQDLTEFFICILAEYSEAEREVLFGLQTV